MNGTSTQPHVLEVCWHVSTLNALNLDEYDDLTATVTLRSDSDEVKVVLTGELEQLAHWVLVEHFGGEVESANELLKAARPAVTYHCSRCGAEQVTTHAPLCGTCDQEVTGVQALAILNAKAGAQTTLANPRRTRL